VKAKLKLPFSILSLLDKNEEFRRKVEQGSTIQKARSELIHDIVRDFVENYEVYRVISIKNEITAVKSDYLDLIYANKGWGQRSFDVWLSMIIELRLGTPKDNPLPPDTHRTVEVFSIPPYLFEGFDTKEQKEKLVEDSIAYLLQTTTPYYKKENTRTIVYEEDDSFYYGIQDIKGLGSKYLDRLIAFSVNHYLKTKLHKSINI
jgi:hypothetical protein